MIAVIMAGGKGTRIQSVRADIPKPMIPFEGKPVLEHEICSLRDQGFRDIILTVSHMSDVIMSYFGDGSRLGVSIRYFREEVPLGNAGALFFLRSELGTEPFLLLNADTVFDVDFNRMAAWHREKGGLATLFTHPNSHPHDSGLLITDADDAVTAWLAKEDPRPEYYRNLVNAGLHIIDPAVLDMAAVDAAMLGKPDPVSGKLIKADLDRQLLKPLAGSGRMFSYCSPEYVRDMGTPERFAAVAADFSGGIVAARNLKNPQKAIFLDRDGTINEYVGFLRDIQDFRLIDGAAEAIRRINRSGYLCIVVTNQPVIARGEVTFGELEEIHKKMETLLGLEGAYLDGIYFCPHHPDKGFAGEVPELKIACSCRKPRPGMLLQAAKDFHIDLSRSWMIGDGQNDVKAGQAAGCSTILISPEEGQDQAVSLLAAVDRILVSEQR